MTFLPQFANALDPVDVMRDAIAVVDELRARPNVESYDVVRVAKRTNLPIEVVRELLVDPSPVRAWRLFRGLSKDELAIRAGISSTPVRRAEQTPGHAMKPATCRALAAALAIPSHALTRSGG